MLRCSCHGLLRTYMHFLCFSPRDVDEMDCCSPKALTPTGFALCSVSKSGEPEEGRECVEHQ